MLLEMIYPDLKFTGKLRVNGSKFSIWKSKVEFVTFETGVSYVLTDSKPSDPTEDSPEEDRQRYKKWIQDDFTCRHIMLGAMEDDLLLFYDRYKTAKEMMDALIQQFVSTSLPRRMLLLKKYTQHKMSEETNIIDHILEMASMARDLEEAGTPVPDPMQAVILMNSLPDSWQQAMGVIMHMDDEVLSLDNVTRHLRIEGQWRACKSHDQQSEGEEPACKKQKKGGFRGTCFACGKRGHCQNDCPDKG